jgi:hypothetical protein
VVTFSNEIFIECFVSVKFKMTIPETSNVNLRERQTDIQRERERERERPRDKRSRRDIATAQKKII